MMIQMWRTLSPRFVPGGPNPLSSPFLRVRSLVDETPAAISSRVDWLGAKMDRDKFLLSSNPAARLSRRRLLARIADHERNTKPALSVSNEVDENHTERRSLLAEDDIQERSTPSSNAVSQSSHGSHPSQTTPRQCKRRLARPVVADDSSSAPQSHGILGKSETNSDARSAGPRKGSQTERAHHSRNTESLPPLQSQICSKPLFSVKKIIPASPREVQKKGAHQIDSPEACKKMQATREAFVLRAKHYLGVLYRPGAKRRDGQIIGAGGFNDRLFLDCCGLVRHCVRDLKSEFGFEIGPWNQAYQMDTLPIALEADQMKPGDLIFVQGRYHDKLKRRPRNDIVHVEIFLGGSSGEESIGARNRNGAVDIFQTYRLQSTSYKVDAFHFRSIDTWLRGNCRPAGGMRIRGGAGITPRGVAEATE